MYTLSLMNLPESNKASTFIKIQKLEMRGGIW
jgi:hypothetical protein